MCHCLEEVSKGKRDTEFFYSLRKRMADKLVRSFKLQYKEANIAKTRSKRLSLWNPVQTS
jgi:hypothetical protein